MGLLCHTPPVALLRLGKSRFPSGMTERKATTEREEQKQIPFGMTEGKEEAKAVLLGRSQAALGELFADGWRTQKI